MSARPDTYLLYAATDAGKTTQLAEIAKWHYARTGEISRLLSADSGWDPFEDPKDNLIIAPENPSGIVEAWNIQGLPDPWSALTGLGDGYWPKTPAVAGNWDRMMIRPTWKDGRLVSADGRKVGQYLIEGLSTIAGTGMQDHLTTGRKLAQDVVGTFTSQVKELVGANAVAKSTTFAAAAMAHYGQVQNFLLEDLVPRFGRLSCARVIWTAHEARGDDKELGESGKNALFGPATVGRAKVGVTTLKFGHTFHLVVDTNITKEPKTGKETLRREFRAYFVSHPDDQLSRMKWPAKVSLPISRAKELLERYPGGYIPDSNIIEFLEFMHPAQPAQPTGNVK
jgi:hypothetical protein